MNVFREIGEYGFSIVAIKILYKFLNGERINGRLIQFMSEERTLKYLGRYDYAWKKHDYQKLKDEKNNKNDTTIVWTMWLQGEANAPELIRICIDSIKSHCNNCKVIVLDDSNMGEYVNIPEYVKEKYNKGYITKTHLSDIIRLLVLKKYGGCWIDSTVFLSDKKNEVELNISDVLKRDFFMIKAPLTLNGFRISSSWLIRAKCGDPIIEATTNLLLEYWKYEKYLRAYFFGSLVFCTSNTK